MTSRIIAVLTVFHALAAAQPDGKIATDVQGVTTYRLWEGEAPGAAGNRELDIPTLTVFRPHPGRGNGTAVIVAPGGAYLGLAANLEGRQVADWFAARGVTAFVLKYRLGKTYLFPTPLVDAQRAITFVRSQAKQFGLSQDRIGIMGFSAGGHLAASAATMFDAGNRPDFLILGYPWLNAMKKDERGEISYCSVLKIEAGKCAFDQYSPDAHVTAQTPPTFIYHTTNDELVPVSASVIFYQALVAAGVDVEMHLFAKGKHGSGLGMGDASLDAWPALLENWLRARGLLTPDAAGNAATASH
jgi:acetyl esterase/lipase